MFKIPAASNLDSYKIGHMEQYPEGTTLVYSNFTPRSDKHLKIPAQFKNGKIVWFGIQAVMKELHESWEETFFKLPFSEVSEKFLRRVKPFIGDNEFSIHRLKYLHDLGYLPILVKALPEGSRVNINVPVFTIVNTVPECFWLTNYLETVLSNESWVMSTSATIADGFKRVLTYWAEETGGNKDFIQWQGHDFSMRGMQGSMSAAKSGAAHLLSFTGTDTLPAVDFLEYYYRAGDTFVGGSVPASEHATMTFLGPIGEKETIRRLIQDIYPSGVVSVVSDSFDFWKTITVYATELKDIILNRKPDSLGLAKVVFRPDSGNPTDIICGVNVRSYSPALTFEQFKDYFTEDVCISVGNDTPHGERGASEVTGFARHEGKVYKGTVEIEWDRYDKQYYFMDSARLISMEEHELSPEEKGAVECLWDIFGGSTNEKGFRTLNQRVGLIYGDSISIETANAILKKLSDKKFASDNIVFGVGSYTYSYNTRDTLGFAIKATYGETHDGVVEIYKDPKTDNGLKKSARGLLKVARQGQDFVLYDRQSWSTENEGELRTVYVDGTYYIEDSLDTIRKRLADTLLENK